MIGLAAAWTADVTDRDRAIIDLLIQVQAHKMDILSAWMKLKALA